MPALPLPRQATFDELGTPLAETTFVVVDLETTGGSPASSAITEIGAVKVRGGEVLGEFQTLVNPMTDIPPFIAVLTGITDAMVATAPALGAVLPGFLEWSRGAVLVAHNAPFDLGFLRAGCAALSLDWPAYESLDTARLARRVLTRDEAPDCKLATLARIFRTTTAPCHRALADARATADVLHGLIERLGNLGVQSLEELATFNGLVPASVRRKRHLADGLPEGPGVYIFRDVQDRPLYIGRSRNVRTRVRQYFVASEPRTRMAEMVGIAERVDAIACAHPLEAEVRELRLIAEHKPRYNRRSRFPEKALWLKLTNEPYPRLAVVRRIAADGATYLGPFGSARSAQAAMAAVHEAVPLRQCTQRLSPRRTSPACMLAGMGRCPAPCEGGVTPADYAPGGSGRARGAARRPGAGARRDPAADGDDVGAGAVRGGGRAARPRDDVRAGDGPDAAARRALGVRGAGRGPAAVRLRVGPRRRPARPGGGCVGVPAGRRAPALRRGAGGRRRDGAPRAGPHTGGDRGGDGLRAALARRARRAAGRPRRRVGVAVVRRCCRAVAGRGRRAGGTPPGRSTTGAGCAPPTGPPAPPADRPQHPACRAPCVTSWSL